MLDALKSWRDAKLRFSAWPAPVHKHLADRFISSMLLLPDGGVSKEGNTQSCCCIQGIYNWYGFRCRDLNLGLAGSIQRMQINAIAALVMLIFLIADIPHQRISIL